MAARKLQIEIDKCFKKVDEGVQIFEGIYDKIHQTGNQSQKEKLEDALKKEIKKLQRSRDQIKTWAASNDIKDKKPLMEKRKLIETVRVALHLPPSTENCLLTVFQQMEKFKAVEKDMKTKAYSKEGLMAGAKLDPKEKEKLETCDFVSKMVEELERQIEQLEAEAENLQATIKKGKKDTSKADKVASIEEQRDRHKWHQSKLELVLRTLENGGIEVDQVKSLEDEIKYYVEENGSQDFVENEEMYDDLNLQEEEEMFGAGNEADRVSSQDAQSIADEPDSDSKPTLPGKQKAGSVSEQSGVAAARRPSTQLKSPLPALATLHTPLQTTSTNGTTTPTMKPAPPPARAPGEPLKYASAAAAAAASDRNGIGIAPLPPPPGHAPTTSSTTGLSPLSAVAAVRTVSTSSPSSTHPHPSSELQRATTVDSKSPALSHTSTAPLSDRGTIAPVAVEPKTEPPSKPLEEESIKAAPDSAGTFDAPQPSTPALTNGDTHSEVEEEPIYHLPSGLSDLLESFEATRSAALDYPNNPNAQRLFAASAACVPEPIDSARPNHYRPQHPFPYTPSHYPQEPLPIFDDQRLYSRIDTDTLFYLFYYRQGTYQQMLAAKALKGQSWRFHKQYSTWFQRHEEPKSITEEYEQGTYRFFDYESTWYVSFFNKFVCIKLTFLTG